MNRQILCALDTHDLGVAKQIVGKLGPHIGGFKIGHSLTLAHGLDVIPILQDAGAHRIFLDLKFHDIPNTVALAVREATRRGVWMLTMHIGGGAAMMAAAVEEANTRDDGPILVGVSVLTSLDQRTLSEELGIPRSIEEHMVKLSEYAIRNGLDGVVCSPLEVTAIRRAVGSSACLVTPGIRLPDGDLHDQQRTGDARSTLANGANYLVIGRALTDSTDPEATLANFQLTA